MLKDTAINRSGLGSPELSAESNLSISVLLSFIDNTIPGFRNYYLQITGNHENLISFHIVNFFNSHLNQTDEGFSPFKFSFVKNPPQVGSKKETDIGVVTLSQTVPSTTIIEFEAKRFSNSSNNKEYVQGERGGIERFKRCDHGAHLTIAGMFGYIQDSKFLNCADQINQWISELSQNNTDSSINWSEIDEKLVSIKELENTSKWMSFHSRKDKSAIQLLHYFLNLTN